MHAPTKDAREVERICIALIVSFLSNFATIPLKIVLIGIIDTCRGSNCRKPREYYFQHVSAV
jgi:hypothetical protein